MHYYGTRLSENISRREPEGYLLCLNVPVARTGTQEYLPEELGLSAASGGNPESTNFTRNKQSPQCGAAPIEGAGKGLPGGGELVQVYRPEAEVFSPETVASFEGMPVTNDHPPEGVDVSNIRALQKGHAHNVRRGNGEESDLLLADLIITDPHLIDLILDGKREISCGYTYELHEENGQYIQRKIRGNHVAVVDAGRAGPRVSIKDHKPERSKTIMKKSLSKILARMAKDGDIETVAEFIEEMLEPEAAPAEAAEEVAEAVEEMAEEPAAVVETPEGTTVVVDEATLADVISRLDQIISLLTPAPAMDESPAEGEPLSTASGGNFERGEVNRNKRSSQCEAAPIEIAVAEAVEAVAEEQAVGELPEAAAEVAEIIGEILEPAAEGPLGEQTGEEDACGDPQPEVISTGDALRTALKVIRPALAKLPKKQLDRVCADIAARLNGKKIARKGIYGAMNDAARRRPDADPDLGKRIMASRNPNYKD